MPFHSKSASDSGVGTALVTTGIQYESRNLPGLYVIKNTQSENGEQEVSGQHVQHIRQIKKDHM